MSESGGQEEGQLAELIDQAIALHQCGELCEAKALYLRVLQIQPDDFDGLHLLGVLSGEQGEHAAAVELISRAIKVNPGFAQAHYNRGLSRQALLQRRAALADYEKAIELLPAYADAHNNRGNVLQSLNKNAEALASYEMAIAVDPKGADAYNNHGCSLLALNQSAQAVASFEKAIALKPDYSEAYNNLGNAYRALYQPDLALGAYDKAITLKPDFSGAHYSRGTLLRAIGEHPEALSCFEKVLALDPGFPYILGDVLHTRAFLCEWTNMAEHFAMLEAQIEDDQAAISPFALLSMTSSLSIQKKVAERFVANNYPPMAEKPQPRKQPRAGKIRIGYFSADFHNHATAYLMAELFERHDKEQFHLTAFSYGDNRSDEMRYRIESAFDRFIDVSAHSDEAVARMARELEIEIAVDLKGFTKHGRTGIFAHQAAPIQVNYLGYPGTMGASYMDYLVADRVLIPEQSQGFYTEKIVYLPDSYQVNDRKRKISTRVFQRKDCGIPEDAFVFCCFNNNYKITPDTFKGWMRILQRVEDGVLWLFETNPSATHNLRREAKLQGIDGARIIVAPRMPLAEHLARHRLANLFLDTHPCNAHTTASDALWADLPVLTVLGSSFASRVAASLLKALRLPELITTSQEQYEAMAVALATTPELLSTIQQKLEANRFTTPLFDTEHFTIHLEAAYTKMIERHRAGLPPENIYVQP